MTEVGAADLSRLLHSKRNEYNAIVTSRKRKLRELYAVATHADSLPRDGFTNPDATEPTPAESQFLQTNDILQDKLFDDASLPKRSEPNVGYFVQSLRNVLFPPNEPQVRPSPVAAKNDVSRPAQPAKQPSPIVPNIKPVPAVAAGRLTPVSSVSSPLSGPVESKSSSASPASTVPNAATLPVVSNNDARPSPQAAPSPIPSDAKARQPSQVSFPPGTKGSPSTTPLQVVPVPQNAARNGVSVSQPGARIASRAGPADGAKAGDAVSSPDSTAASAATPHVHHASTDTSPDKEAPPKLEGSQEPALAAQPAQKTIETGTPVRESENATGTMVDSAEEQLLQESRRSVQLAIPSVAGEPTKAPFVSTPPTKVSAPAPAMASETAPSVTKTSEVPDSQEEVIEKMDVDEDVAPPSSELLAESHQTADRKPSVQTGSASSQQPQSPSKEAAQVPERAVTRVSSGAMRLKSVTEIVGGTPKPISATDRPTTQDLESQLTPLTSTSHSPSSRYRHGRPISRGHVSTVLFGKQPKRSEEKAQAPDDKEILNPADDYFTPLFVQGYTNASTWMQPMEKLLYQANKTIGTPDALLALQDHQACKVLRRVYHLQQNDKWSLRQPKRCPEPTRQASTWDVLIKEAKWMRTDFREERKWKMAIARNMAYACAEWHAASPELRKEMQVATHIPPKGHPAADVSMADADEEGPENQPTPDLVSSADSPQNIEELADDLTETVAPSAIFALQEDDLVFGLRRSPTADRLLDELPMYGSPLQVPKVDPLNPDFDPDALWRRPALPLSKYVEGQMKVVAPVPPRKRSRFEFEDDSSDDEAEILFTADNRVHHMHLPPTSDAVSLFKPEMKHTRDRLHAGHQFRPPSEHPMPVQNFYECRSPSQWTQSEDDELRTLVREYTYNWPLISGMLSSRSHFTSGAERRTPWECFERWIGLEGLPADMSKTQYFKAYNSRIEAAQRVIMQQNQLAAQQASASGGNTTPLRRRPSTPLRVERRRNQKHLALIDAMRKLAKKRETQQQKQQQTAAQNAANKKPIDTSSQRLPTKTPRDYSLLRWERDQALAERMAQYAAKQGAQRRAAVQAARGQGQPVQGQAGQAQSAQGAVPAGQQVNHAGAVNGVNGVQRTNIPSHVAAAAAAAAAAQAQQQGRPRMPLQAPVNGMANGGGVQAHMNGGLAAPVAHMNGQPQMQATLQAQQQPLSQQQQQQQRVQMPTSQAELMMRAQRMAEQQRNAIQMQQHQAQQHPQQHQQHLQQQQQQQAQSQQSNAGTPGSQGTQGSPPMRNGVANMNQQNFMNNAQNILAQYNAAGANGGHNTPKSGLHMPSLAAGSPGQAQARPQQQFPNNISQQLAQLEANFLAKNPSLTPEQTRQLATEHLTRAMMQQRQSAMNAAAGGAAAAAALANAQPGIANGIGATTSPHQYAALLRQQQQQQQANQAAQSASPVPQPQQLAHQRQSSEGSTPNVPK